MKKVYLSLKSIKEFKSIKSDEFNSIRLYLSEDLLLLSNKELIKFIYRKSNFSINDLFSSVYSSKYNLNVYRLGKSNYYSLNQIIDLLKLKLDSRLFCYCKNQDRQRRLFSYLLELQNRLKDFN